MRFDATQIQPELQQLVPMLRTWAIGDDAERSERLVAAPDRQLVELTQSVVPELARIDALIDSEDEPLSDEAILLGRLAEAAREAHHELNSRADR